MRVVKLAAGETFQPEPGWLRVSLAGDRNISVEYFEKPVGHTSPLHTHPHEQVSIVLKGKMRVVNGDGESDVLSARDSAYFGSKEWHRTENVGDELAVGVDIFVPARPFDFWKKKSQLFPPQIRWDSPESPLHQKG
jgi:quercetin dioxygenase-like cupin family protein